MSRYGYPAAFCCGCPETSSHKSKHIDIRILVPMFYLKLCNHIHILAEMEQPEVSKRRLDTTAGWNGTASDQRTKAGSPLRPRTVKGPGVQHMYRSAQCLPACVLGKGTWFPGLCFLVVCWMFVRMMTACNREPRPGVSRRTPYLLLALWVLGSPACPSLLRALFLHIFS